MRVIGRVRVRMGVIGRVRVGIRVGVGVGDRVGVKVEEVIRSE